METNVTSGVIFLSHNHIDDSFDGFQIVQLWPPKWASRVLADTRHKHNEDVKKCNFWYSHWGDQKARSFFAVLFLLKDTNPRRCLWRPTLVQCTRRCTSWFISRKKDMVPLCMSVCENWDSEDNRSFSDLASLLKTGTSVRRKPAKTLWEKLWDEIQVNCMHNCRWCGSSRPERCSPFCITCFFPQHVIRAQIADIHRMFRPRVFDACSTSTSLQSSFGPKLGVQDTPTFFSCSIFAVAKRPILRYQSSISRQKSPVSRQKSPIFKYKTRLRKFSRLSDATAGEPSNFWKYTGVPSGGKWYWNQAPSAHASTSARRYAPYEACVCEKERERGRKWESVCACVTSVQR